MTVEVSGPLFDEGGNALANMDCVVVAVDDLIGQSSGARVRRGVTATTNASGVLTVDLEPGRHVLYVNPTANNSTTLTVRRFAKLTVLTGETSMTLQAALDTDVGDITASTLQLAQEAAQEAADSAAAAEAAAASIGAATAVIVLSGQSNAMSTNPQSEGGDLTPDSSIRFWTGSEWVMMDPQNGVGVPEAGRNNIAFQAAKEAMRSGYAAVYVIISGKGGTAISGWVGSGTSSEQYVDLKTAVEGALGALPSVDRVTHFLWAQGESDGGGSVDILGYQSSFETLKSQLRNEVWFNYNTPITCTEMPPQGAANTMNQFFVGTVPFDSDPYVTTTRTKGLDAGADTLHWTGDAIDIIGARMWATIEGDTKEALPMPGSLNHPVFFARLDSVFGKGLLAQYNKSKDQINIGSSSDNLYPGIIPFITMDLNDDYIRFDKDAFSLNSHEFLKSAIIKSVIGAEFADVSSDVNTKDKKAGALYRNNLTDALMMATGSEPEAEWVEHYHSGNAPPLYKGFGTPEGSVTAPVGSLYTRTDGGAGTTLYVKESGTGNTGWVAK